MLTLCSLSNLERSGAFLAEAQVWEEPLMEHAMSKVDAERLWHLSEELVGHKFNF